MRLRLVRHGETDWNAQGRIQGHIDIPLNDRGRAQARELAQALSGSGAALVITSDLARARETAEIVAAHLGIPLQVSDRLRERRLGALQGMTAADLGASEPGFVARMVNDPGTRPEGAETLEEFRARIAAFLDDLVARPPADDVILVVHGGTVRAAMLALVGDDHRRALPRVGNCAVVRVDVDATGVRVSDDREVATDDAHTADESVAS